MKLGIAIGCVLSACFVVATSCSVQHRSEEFACTKNLDCDPGRVCVDGFCVQGGTVVDAPKGDAPRADAGPNCPAACTSCNVTDKTCTINCTLRSCTTTIACPPGYTCDILCNTENSCRNGVNCAQAKACNIECSGRQSCQNVQCGPGPCDVNCSGPSSCRNIVCGTSCACDVGCSGNQSCQDNIFCSSIACESGSGCTSLTPFCETCP